MMTRRGFFGGGAAFAAWSAFAGRGDTLPIGKPRIKFGVLSDIHILRSGLDEKIETEGNALTFIRALEWFRDQGVDAVAITGDMADKGNDINLMAVAEAWYSVFPQDRYPDGRKIEKLFITGNHDWCGDTDAHNEKLWPDRDERMKHVLRADMAGWWEKAFHEAYEPIWRKEINGYTFIGCHWDTTDGYPFERIKEWMERNARTLDPAMPFFYMQHPHLRDTCYGPWAWGRDRGVATKTLSAFPNAIALSGHSHYPLTDERTIWRGAFTSAGCSSLRYQSCNYDEFPPAGFENWTGGGKEGWRANANKFLKKLYCGDSRQGMLWSVYDGEIVIRKREFLAKAAIGQDWILPLGKASAPWPCAVAARTPQFDDGAKLKTECVRAKNRGGRERNGPGVVEAVEQDALKVIAPPVAKNEAARAQYYEFAAVCADGTKIVKRVLPPSFHHSTANWRKMKESVFCIFGKSELGEGNVRFEVAAVNSLGAKGSVLQSGIGNQE